MYRSAGRGADRENGTSVALRELPQTRFAPTTGARLAYQVFGSGEQTVVAIPPTAQNIEL